MIIINIKIIIKKYSYKMLINRIISRHPFSVLSKVRQHLNLKKGTSLRPIMKSHLLEDFVGQTSY